MGLSKAEVLALLDGYAAMPQPTGPVALDAAYLRAVERWERLPENGEGADKSWVPRSQRGWDSHFARARPAS